jgi:hypothetical protein
LRMVLKVIRRDQTFELHTTRKGQFVPS